MKPVKFPGHNMTLAEDQPEYQLLPVCYQGGTEGRMTSCWSLSLWERIKLLFSGKLYLSQLTFNQRLQPQLPELEWKEPKCDNCGKAVGLHKQPHFNCPKDYAAAQEVTHQPGQFVKFYHPIFGDDKKRDGVIVVKEGQLHIRSGNTVYEFWKCENVELVQ